MVIRTAITHSIIWRTLFPESTKDVQSVTGNAWKQVTGILNYGSVHQLRNLLALMRDWDWPTLTLTISTVVIVEAASWLSGVAGKG